MGDLDGDLDMDIIGTTDVATGSGATWWVNFGFEDEWGSIPIWAPADSGYVDGIAAADMNGDGDQDVILFVVEGSSGDDYTPKLLWMENTGLGETWLEHEIAVSACVGFRPVDMDGDGDVDLQVMDNDGLQWVFWWYENGDGSFGEVIEHEAGTLAECVTYEVGDLSGDGLPDISCGNEGELNILVNPGTLSGSWNEIAISVAGLVWDHELADLDLDGDQDVVMVVSLGEESTESELVMLESKSGGAAWASCPVENAVDGLYDIVATDIDGDGDPDVAGITYQEEYWWENLQIP